MAHKTHDIMPKLTNSRGDGALWTKKDIEEITGITFNTIKGWSDFPAHVSKKGVTLKYNSKEILQYFMTKHLSDQMRSIKQVIGDEDKDYAVEKLYWQSRETRAKTLEREGKLIPLDIVKEITGEYFAECQKSMTKIPSAMTPYIDKDVREKLDEEIRKVLGGLGLVGTVEYPVAVIEDEDDTTEETDTD